MEIPPGASALEARKNRKVRGGMIRMRYKQQLLDLSLHGNEEQGTSHLASYFTEEGGEKMGTEGGMRIRDGRRRHVMEKERNGRGMKQQDQIYCAEQD